MNEPLICNKNDVSDAYLKRLFSWLTRIGATPKFGKNCYQYVNAYGARQLGHNHVELLVENFLVVALLYYATGVLSVEQVPNLDIAV